DIVASVEGKRDRDHLVDAEAGPRHVGRAAIDAIDAIEQAVIGQQDLEQRHAPAIGRVGMTDAIAGRADPVLSRRAPGRARGGAGCVVLGGISENSQLFGQLVVHGTAPFVHYMFFSLHRQALSRCSPRETEPSSDWNRARNSARVSESST